MTPRTRTALLVVAHPRSRSLTARVAARARERLEGAGFAVDLLDLHAEGFDPRMTVADEPDWGDRDKTYSAGTETHMRRLAAADTIVVVFPVWWFGLPAILKGWIDRVWNHGFAYGGGRSRLRGKRLLWLGLAGYSEERFTAGGWDTLLTRQLTQGIAGFCGIEDVTVRLLYGTVPEGTAGDDHVKAVLTAADAALP
ncbi:NAD(P)H oxidoreductase [Streptomyces specialis]|uniref:NAD(P)H oxidoreductase n=1 Tax=Streptomyces specialis TaxID=498367 RepID=UPI00073EB753|nr:NAD(P)H oxidoreductase [Streptomyces specialis]